MSIEVICSPSRKYHQQVHGLVEDLELLRPHMLKSPNHSVLSQNTYASASLLKRPEDDIPR